MFQRVVFVLLAAAMMSASVAAPFAHLHAPDHAHGSPASHGHGEIDDHSHAAAGAHERHDFPRLHAHLGGHPDDSGTDARVLNLPHHSGVVSTTTASECPEAPAGLDPMVARAMELPPLASVTASGPPGNPPPPDPPPLFRGAPRGPPQL